MQRTYTNLIIHVISDVGVLRMRRAFNQFCIDGHCALWSGLMRRAFNQLCIDGHCAPWSGLIIFLVVLAVASMLMSVRSSSTITVQETLSVALYTA